MDITGGCRCSRYRFYAPKDPFWISYCHCNDCRKSTAAPVTVFVGFKSADIVLLGEQAGIYHPTPSVLRLFCKQCGTPIGYQDDQLSEEIYYYLGVFNNPSALLPRRHAWVAERLVWWEITDDLPHYQYFSRPRHV